MLDGHDFAKSLFFFRELVEDLLNNLCSSVGKDGFSIIIVVHDSSFSGQKGIFPFE
jgi:hypothetical protein